MILVVENVHYLRYNIMQYILFCYRDGNTITKDKHFRKFHKGDFVKKCEERDDKWDVTTRDITKAELYDDYSELYDDFAVADMFFAIPVEITKIPNTALYYISGDITKDKKDRIIELDFLLFWQQQEK